MSRLAMAESEDDAAAQIRIVKHMNKDHQDSLIRYLRHYHCLTSFRARSAKLTAIRYSGMTIQTSSYPFPPQDHHIPFDPPLESWSDIRPRASAMDKEACSSLKCSPITINKYVPPNGFLMIINFALCGWTYITFCRRSHFVTGSYYYEYFFRFFPAWARFCYAIQPYIIWLVIGIHAVESVIVARTKLIRHTVRIFSRVWWFWVLSQAIEGIGASTRFDRLVKEEEKRRAKQKH